MYNAGLHEILTTRMWDILPTAYHAYKQQVEHNMFGHIPFVVEHDNLMKPSMVCSKTGFTEQVYAGDATYMSGLTENDQVINILPINGPITRNGGACSYGSKEIRDWVIEAANMPQTIGHIFYIDSPGGSAQSKYDFEQAIEYLHERGQKAIAFVDGMACSAGYALAAMCDEIYVMNPNNQIGCIGTMCAFTIQRHGDEDEQTHERYVELYAEGSPYKNREFRDAADGNYDSLIADLNRSAEDFKAMVRRCRPNVNDEQLLGDIYDASEVIGTMIDGIGTMGDCIERMLEITGAEQPENKVEEPEAPESVPEDEPQTEEVVSTEEVDEVENIEIENKNLNQKEMKDYLKIQAALGVEALCSDKEDALFLNAEQCEALEQHLGECEQKAGALDAKMTENASLNAIIENMKAEHASAIEALETAHAEAIETLKAEHVSAIETIQSEHTKVVDGLNTQIEELNGKLTEANNSIAAKDAEIAELSEKPVDAPKPAEVPVDNHVGAVESTGFNRLCTAEMTAAERREALKKWDRPSC